METPSIEVQTRCTTCTHPELDAINARLLDRETVRSVAMTFGLKYSAVWRHFKNGHIRRPLPEDRHAERIEMVQRELAIAAQVGSFDEELEKLLIENKKITILARNDRSWQ